MLSHQEVALFERIRRIRKYGFVGRNVSLGVGGRGFEVSKADARPDLSLSLPIDNDVDFSYCSRVRCTTMHPATMTKDSEAVSQPPVKCFLS